MSTPHPPAESEVTDRILTIPNALSGLRVLGVPLFVFLLLGPHDDAWAIGILMASGVTDYLDGRLARMLRQTSRLGVLLDPLADRLYIGATLVSLAIRGAVPWWLTGALFGRDLLLAATIPALRRRGQGPLPVHFLGKAATFNLLYAFPLLLLAHGHSVLANVSRPLGWAFAVWGSTLYWYAALLYLAEVRKIISSPTQRRAPRPRLTSGA